MVLGRAAIHDFANSRVLERLLMYERRLERSLNKTMDELHKRKLIRQLEQANKEIEQDDFEKIDYPEIHPQASLGAATLKEVETPGSAQLRRGKKNTKQSQSFDSAQDRSGFVDDYTGTGPQRQNTEEKAKIVPIT